MKATRWNRLLIIASAMDANGPIQIAQCYALCNSPRPSVASHMAQNGIKLLRHSYSILIVLSTVIRLGDVPLVTEPSPRVIAVTTPNMYSKSSWSLDTWSEHGFWLLLPSIVYGLDLKLLSSGLLLNQDLYFNCILTMLLAHLERMGRYVGRQAQIMAVPRWTSDKRTLFTTLTICRLDEPSRWEETSILFPWPGR